jgi:hypothetical protein
MSSKMHVIMKQIIFILAVASLTSCHNRQKEAAAQAQKTIDSLNTVMAQQRIIDSMNEVATMQYQMEQEQAAQQAPVASTRRSSGSSGGTKTSGTTSTTTYNNYGAQPQAQTQAPAAQKRKGWSNKATGAAIGTGVGAVTGAIISDKKGTGAIIGGLSGAAVGLGTGAIIDANQANREERIKRREERRARRQ